MIRMRAATVADARALGVIHSQSWKAAYQNIIADSILDNITAEKRQQYFEEAISEGREEMALLFSNEQALGFICIGRCRDEDQSDSSGEIWGLYLHPDYWGQGFGTQLMNWGIDILKGRGYDKITLWVLEDNISAIRFYEKMGFRHDGTVKEINIGTMLNECRYVKEFIKPAKAYLKERLR